MGRRGPPKKPTKLRLLEGNPSKRPINHDEPQPPAVRQAKAPKFLNTTAQTEWNRLAPELIDLGLLTTLDFGLLTMLCHSWSQFVSASERAEKTGMMIIGKAGRPLRNPYLKIIRDAKAEYLRFSQEFGMGAAARSRIQMFEEKKEDPLDQFLDGGK